ncbi:MAG: CRISPR-associated endonuclease Cas2 [Magnetococcus sp. WYHC-3]
MAQDRRYLISYDVPVNGRRTRLSTCLDSYGTRVQRSVFEVVLPPALFLEMLAAVEKILDPKVDKVAIYPLCSACSAQVRRLGTSGPAPGEERVFVV